MLRKLRILYHNNKTKIWLILGIIIFVYVIIRMFNAQIKKENEEKINNGTNQNFQVTTYLPSSQTSVMTNSSTTKENVKKDTEIIKNFIDFCNDNNIEEAYNLLSQQCKDELYKNINDFYNKYYKNIFNEKKSYDIENWASSKNITYKVKYLNDIMSSGTVNEEYIEEYITVVTENNEKKLNINQFIGKEELNLKRKTDNLNITVVNKYVYYDYEEYEIIFENNTDKNIILDKKENTESVYIEDTKDVKYTWFGNEVPNSYLNLNSGESKRLRLKFNEIYTGKKTDSTIYLTDVNIDGQEEKATIKINVR